MKTSPPTPESVNPVALNNQVELDTDVAAIDELFTNQFTDYLGIPKRKLISLSESRDILQKKVSYLENKG